MRSKLFLPGVRPELFDKALAGPADALSFDLEDSVPADRKAVARAAVRAWLLEHAARVRGRTLIVRVNALDSPDFAEDVHAVVQPGLDLLNLPKPESPAAVRAAAAVLAQAERANGLTRPVRLLVNVETPRALREAAALAGADARVAGLQLGLGDLFEPLGIDRHESAALHPVMLALRLAAGEAGVFACDGAHPGIRDLEAFRAEAMLARRLGYVGKSCIHPAQVPVANAVFRPSAAELAHARRVVEAARDAQAAGRGAWSVDGRMVDAPFLRRAEDLLAQAARLADAPD